MDTVRCIVPAGDHCGEGACWSQQEQALYWTDINRFLLHRYDAREKTTKSWLFDEPVTAANLTDRPGTLLIALGSKLILWSPESDRRDDVLFHLKGFPEVRFNDCRPDPRGDFWAGTMHNNVAADGQPLEWKRGAGQLLRIRKKEASIWKTDIGISNTLCWNPEQTRFYFGDSLENTIWVYDYDRTHGEIARERPFLSGFTRGVPDGSALDSAGYLWNCRFGGGCLVRVGPDGVIDRIIEMPVLNITTCTFGGPDLKTLFITTASIDRHPSDRLAGGLFALTSPVAGQAENCFCL